jgi:hypothetical protein
MQAILVRVRARESDRARDSDSDKGCGKRMVVGEDDD